MSLVDFVRIKLNLIIYQTQSMKLFLTLVVNIHYI